MTLIVAFSSFIFFWALTLNRGALGEFLLLWGAGWLILQLCCKKEHRLEAQKIYTILMLFYGAYAFLCHAYRVYHNFEAIGSMDGPGYYLPCTMELFDSESLSELISNINEQPRYAGGGFIFVYFVPIARLAYSFNIDLHLAIQLALMPFAALICVVEYHLLKHFDIPASSAYKWSIGFGLGSALFWLSSFIVRDLPIQLAYAMVIYLLFSPMPRWCKLLLGIIFTLVAASIRMASGLGIVPLLMLAICSRQNRGGTISAIGLVLCIVAMIASGLYSFAISKLSTVSQIYLNIELADQHGMSTLSSFNSLPFGISHIAKTLYAQLHPIPAWLNMFPSAANGFRSYAYNITKFPDIWVLFFRLAAVMTLIYGCCNAALRRIVAEHKCLLYSFIYAILWLCSQASTIEERRKLGIYPLLFLVAVLFWRRLDANIRKSILMFSTWMFVGLQLLYLMRLLTRYEW